MKQGIAAGDIVSVNFYASQITLCQKAKVLYKPNSVGDFLIIEDQETMEIIYTSEPCTIKKATK